MEKLGTFRIRNYLLITKSFFGQPTELTPQCGVSNNLELFIDENVIRVQV